MLNIYFKIMEVNNMPQILNDDKTIFSIRVSEITNVFKIDSM